MPWMKCHLKYHVSNVLLLAKPERRVPGWHPGQGDCVCKVTLGPRQSCEVEALGENSRNQKYLAWDYFIVVGTRLHCLL